MTSSAGPAYKRVLLKLSGEALMGDGQFGIMPRYHGRLIVNDDPQREGCLIIEYGKPYAMYRGRGLALPDDNTSDVERYRRQVSEAAMR